MKTTLDLLDRATKAIGPISERALSQRLGHSPTAITTAKQRGNLSPVLAGQLAEAIGEDIPQWMAIAALEAAPRSRVSEHLRRAIAQLTI